MAGRAGADNGGDAAVVAAARDGETDRYLAALLAPSQVRPDLLALAAFSAEIARIPLVAASEPAIGEIRLQWWRDALEAARGSARTGAPVADALRAAVERHGLPRALLDDMIEARSFELAGALVVDETSLRGYLWKSEGAPFALAARIVAPSVGTDADGAAVACGYAYGLTRLLLGLPRTLSLGRMPLPQSRLDAAGVKPQELLAGVASEAIARLLGDLRAEARSGLVASRQHVASLPRAARTAFLPLALVESYLRALERPGRDLLRGAAEIAPLTRVCRIVVAHWLGRI